MAVRILIDGDGCPVVDLAIQCARPSAAEVIIFCDWAHHYQREGAQTVTVDSGPDSADFHLVNRVRPGDVVVTQDYGLAAMCLAKRAIVLHQDGWAYTDQNISALLASRHEAARFRSAGGRTKGPAKRTKGQDRAFERALRLILAGEEPPA